MFTDNMTYRYAVMCLVVETHRVESTSINHFRNRLLPTFGFFLDKGTG